jgi:hypothetical protein
MTDHSNAPTRNALATTNIQRGDLPPQPDIPVPLPPQPEIPPTGPKEPGLPKPDPDPIPNPEPNPGIPPGLPSPITTQSVAAP